jgi:predicted ribonuclease YlaK
MIEEAARNNDEYTGYKEIYANDEVLTKFYQDINYNHFNLLIGEYLILRSIDGEILDLRKWSGSSHDYLDYEDFNSNWFGKVKPYKNDPYQKLLFDSLSNNQFTIIRGKAGSGKSYIAMAYLVQQLEKNRIDKIIIFCNPVATRDSVKLGFYPGDKNTKLLDSQIGNFLVGKFGGIEAIERLINEGKIELIPVSDCRGMDINVRAGVYVTEAQNTTIDTMQLILQRIGENCICIIEGDDRTQVDLDVYKNNNNGLIKASKVFRGQSYYGEVTLKQCHRSRIAERAELMRG